VCQKKSYSDEIASLHFVSPASTVIASNAKQSHVFCVIAKNEAIPWKIHEIASLHFVSLAMTKNTDLNIGIFVCLFFICG
ncbi:MAG: hypothetical protein AAB969_03110, partial [Patescibacteria group bacterium]